MLQTIAAPPYGSAPMMLISGGFNISFRCIDYTPMVLMIRIRPERAWDCVQPEIVTFCPDVPFETYLDGFGNLCTRIVAPPGDFSIWNRFLIGDGGELERLPINAVQTRVQDLPQEALVYLMGSRYCETDKLSQYAWAQFGGYWEGWPRVKAILDFVHNHLQFNYTNARCDRTAFEAFNERTGVCRDFAHLAITLCRCMNIPARYCTGYLGDIGVPRDPAPMDFSAWFEVHLGGQWWTLDARHNKPRIGRVLIAQGRDAADVAISTVFGTAPLTEFRVITDEIGATSYI